MGVAQAWLGSPDEGARTLREVRAWAEEHGERALLARSHWALSGLFVREDEPGLSLEHAVRAVELLDDEVDARVRGDHLLCLADALSLIGSYDESITRYHEAAGLLGDCAERFHVVLNNLAYTQYEGGLTLDAAATADRLLVEVTASGLPMLRGYGETIARAFIAAGRLDEAAAVLEPLCGGEASREDCAGFAWALLALSAVRRLGGSFDAAQDCLDRAGALIEEYALGGHLVAVMREQAELHAARGHFKSAYEEFVAFHRAETELHAVERHSRARTLHAIFEANEARRQSVHFLELSERDPLTGLHNRRHLDSALTALLDRVLGDEASLTIGLVDLDHFKRINDARSHAVGDDVLKVVAGILQSSAARAENGFAARMGGEEFLIVLPATTRDEGIKHLESLRHELSTHPWDEITGDILVTASIGIAAAPDDAVERLRLLEIADQNLYRAKREGRDRVVSSESPLGVTSSVSASSDGLADHDLGV
jgi:diguanylate cyclase (GGDEF)-like protein